MITPLNRLGKLLGHSSNVNMYRSRWRQAEATRSWGVSRKRYTSLAIFWRSNRAGKARTPRNSNTLRFICAWHHWKCQPCFRAICITPACPSATSAVMRHLTLLGIREKAAAQVSRDSLPRRRCTTTGQPHSVSTGRRRITKQVYRRLDLPKSNQMASAMAIYVWASGREGGR